MSKKNIYAESLVGIIVGVFILSLAIIGVGKLISHSKGLISSYNDSTHLRILKSNLSNILKNVDTSGVLENQVFYIYKNNSTQEFEVFTGSTNSQYKYIDTNGDLISNLVTYDKEIYARFLYIQREDTALDSQNQVIRASIRKLIKK